MRLIITSGAIASLKRRIQPPPAVDLAPDGASRRWIRARSSLVRRSGFKDDVLNTQPARTSFVAFTLPTSSSRDRSSRNHAIHAKGVRSLGEMDQKRKLTQCHQPLLTAHSVGVFPTGHALPSLAYRRVRFCLDYKASPKIDRIFEREIPPRVAGGLERQNSELPML